MFKKILIVNRGEIAVRVIRACREIGIPTIAVYSTADEDSLHVSLATEACCIGPAPSSESYLNIPSIISCALTYGADAIHPGCGFMAENPDFVDICSEHNIKFIGPGSEHIRKMGNKAEARKTVQALGISTVPGSDTIKSIDDIKAFVAKFGFPIILKPTAGGGGKGMRILRSFDKLEDTYKLSQQEAEKYFGNPDLYVEKYFEESRHIEIQIIADSYGKVVHLGERDCSLQRRYQKLIEESPSMVVGKTLREKMAQDAVNIAKSINYEGVGTVEFLLDSNGDYYFIEMNTRIQVEHTVSEMLTNIDLVKEQIKIAAGLPLSFSQEDINFNGHVIECRINAEDPENGFLPSPGEVKGYIAPGGFGVRVDSHVYSGYVIPPYYDSLLGKVICCGRNREEARRRMYRALKEFVITGVKTTLPFYRELIENQDYINGNFDTKFIDNYIKTKNNNIKTTV